MKRNINAGIQSENSAAINSMKNLTKTPSESQWIGETS
jgi:hypothetical protein